MLKQKSIFAAVLILCIAAATLIYTATDELGEVKPTHSNRHTHAAKLPPLVEPPAHGTVASPFAPCSPLDNCSAMKDIEPDESSLPVRTQLQVHLKALRNADYMSINFMHQLIDNCSKQRRAELLLSKHISIPQRRGMAECDVDEATDMINEIDFEFKRQLASVVSTTDAHNLRMLWLATKAGMYDSVNSQDDTKIEITDTSLVIHFSDVAPAKKSPVWEELYRLANSRGVQDQN